MSNSADPEQLKKPTDVDLHFCIGKVFPNSAGQGKIMYFKTSNICENILAMVHNNCFIRKLI